MLHFDTPLSFSGYSPPVGVGRFVASIVSIVHVFLIYAMFFSKKCKYFCFVVFVRICYNSPRKIGKGIELGCFLGVKKFKFK